MDPKATQTNSNSATVTTVSDAASSTIDTSKMTAQDILTRSSKMTEPAAAKQDTDVTLDDLKESIKFDDIKDPKARALAEKRIKELEAGFNKKYEKIAEIRKDLESKINQATNRQWTQEELDRALKDPSFVQLVQARQQQAAASAAPATWEGSTEEWSALTPEEKQQFAQLNNRLSAQEQIMHDMLKTQEDQKLKELYPDFDPRVVDQIQQDLLAGRVQATREHLWKIANFESAVQRAYRLGLQDRGSNLNEKLIASNNLPAHSVTPNGEVPEDIKKQGFPAIAKFRLAQMRGKK